MARPNWEYIRIDVLLMEHPKIEGLSDKAFRALFDLWCYCGRNRNDGIVTGKRWQAVPPKIRAELVAAGLADTVDIGGGVVMHDFTGPDGHQRSREEIDELAERRAEIARKAANARWSKPHALRTAQSNASSMHEACAMHMHQRCQGSGRGRGRYKPAPDGTTSASTCLILRRLNVI